MKDDGAQRYDLADRLIEFAVQIIDVAEALPNTRAGAHIAGQLVRCGTSPAPNHAESQSAESRNDFIHKLRIALKELRETRIWLLIIQRKSLAGEPGRVASVLAECNELIAILAASVRTARKKKGKQT